MGTIDEMFGHVAPSILDDVIMVSDDASAKK